MLPERINAEPDYSPAGFLGICVYVFQLIIGLLFISFLAVFALAPYLIFRIFFPRPPIVVNPRLVAYYMKKAFFEQTASNEILFSMRLRIFLNILILICLTPVLGMAWFLDDIFFPGYRKARIEKPLFMVSAARSGSTQLSQYLEENPGVIAPSLLKQVFPFIWLWKIAPKLFGRFVTEEKMMEMMKKSIRPEFLERHEVHPMKSGTFEVLYSGLQLVNHCMVLGPKVLAEGLSWGRSNPASAPFWEVEMVRYIDALGKKLIHVTTSGNEGTPGTLMIKGHFLASAPALQRKFNDAHFLTILREPESRIRSLINFLRVAPEVHLNGAIPWEWLIQFARDVEVEYCKLEQQWYSADPENRTVVRFQDYRDALPQTLEYIYRRCLPNIDSEGYVFKEHFPRKRHGYAVDRSWEELGVDPAVLTAPLSEYKEWCLNPGEGALKSVSALHESADAES